MKIAIASGKGGTGKTTLATNLACYLAEKRDVVLVDMDVEAPNTGLFFPDKDALGQEIQFYMVPRWDESPCMHCKLCQEVCAFNAIIQIQSTIMVYPELCHGCYACSELCPEGALSMIPYKMGVLSHYKSHALHVVESRLDIGQERTALLVSRTHEYIQNRIPHHDTYIYDAPPGTSCPAIEATREADFVILVTEPTPFGLHDLKLAVETMRLLDRPFGVVVNRWGIGNNDILQYCRTERIEILTRIPNDRRMAQLYSQGALIYREVPEMARKMEDIASVFFTENVRV
jgi:MinD superfamily P-loop ATPase